MVNIVKSVDSIAEMILFYTTVGNRDFDVVVTDSQGDNRIFHFDPILVGENNDVNIFNGAYCPHNGVLNLRWGGAVMNGVTDDSVAIQRVINVLKTTNNLHPTLNVAINESNQGGVFILDGKARIKTPLYYHSSMKIIGNGFFNSAFICDPETHQHHMFGADITASRIGKKSFINIQLENLAFINKKDKTLYGTSRLGYNPHTRHCIYFENTRLTSLNNVLFDGFINGTADSVGYATNETIDSTDKTNINFRAGLHPDEKTASTTFTDFTYQELFDVIILQNISSTAGWAWNHKRDNVYYQNNHLNFWARNGGTTSVITGGSCEISSNWNKKGNDDEILEPETKRFDFYSRQTGFSVQSVIMENQVFIEAGILCSDKGSNISCYIEYHNSKADIKYITSNEGGGGTLAGIRSGNGTLLDLSDASWDWQSYNDGGTARASNNVTIGSPIKVNDYLPNLDFKSGLSFWKPLENTIDIAVGNFQGWDTFELTKAVKASLDFDNYYNVPVLTLEKLRDISGTSRFKNLGMDYLGNKEINGNTRYFMTCIVKTIKGGVNDVPLEIRINKKVLRKTVILPNDWCLYVCSFESGQSLDGLDVKMLGTAVIGDKLLVHSFNIYTGGYDIFASTNKVINSYGWCSPHPQGLNNDFTNRSNNIVDKTRWAYSVQNLKYSVGDVIKQSKGLHDMGSNSSVGIKVGNPYEFICVKEGYAYRIEWVAGTYYEDDLVKGSDDDVYRCVTNGTTDDPVGSANWNLVGASVEWVSKIL